MNSAENDITQNQTIKFPDKSNLKGIYKFFYSKSKYDIFGDIHGCKEELTELLGKLGYTQNNKLYRNPERTAVFLGDLTDRGPDSMGVVEIVYNMVKKNSAIYVPGNHCNKLYRYITGRKVKINNGLETTVEEMNKLQHVKKSTFENKFRGLYESACIYYILDEGKLIVSHGGVKEKMIGKVSESVKTQCLYGDITGEKEIGGYPVRLDWAKDYRGYAYNVYGHTPVIESKMINKTINIDEGCVFGNKLAAFRYPELEKVEVDSHMPKAEEQWQRMMRNYLASS